MLTTVSKLYKGAPRTSQWVEVLDSSLYREKSTGKTLMPCAPEAPIKTTKSEEKNKNILHNCHTTRKVYTVTTSQAQL